MKIMSIDINADDTLAAINFTPRDNHPLKNVVQATTGYKAQPKFGKQVTEKEDPSVQTLALYGQQRVRQIAKPVGTLQATRIVRQQGQDGANFYDYQIQVPSSDKAKPPAVSPVGLWDSLSTRADTPSPIAVLDTSASVPSLPGPENCVCKGYVCACFAYDPERNDNAPFDFDRARQHRLWVNACVYNLLYGDKAGFSLHAQSAGENVAGQIHAEEICVNLLLAVSERIAAFDKKDCRLLAGGKPAAHKFALQRLGLKARIRFQGSQSSVCGACLAAVSDLESKLDALGIAHAVSCAKDG